MFLFCVLITCSSAHVISYLNDEGCLNLSASTHSFPNRHRSEQSLNEHLELCKTRNGPTDAAVFETTKARFFFIRPFSNSRTLWSTFQIQHSQASPRKPDEADSLDLEWKLERVKRLLKSDGVEILRLTAEREAKEKEREQLKQEVVSLKKALLQLEMWGVLYSFDCGYYFYHIIRHCRQWNFALVILHVITTAQDMWLIPV